jgi:hypothetical protein
MFGAMLEGFFHKKDGETEGPPEADGPFGRFPHCCIGTLEHPKHV